MSLAKSSIFFSLGTLLSRLSGLARDMVLFGVFGASALLDAFIVAFRIPNLLREMLAEGALSSAFTKVYSALMVENRDRALKLLRDALWLFSLLASLISLLGMITAPYLVELMTLNLSAEQGSAFVKNATIMTRILFPYLGLTMISSVVAGALYEKGSFFVSSVSPMAFNLGFILGAGFLSFWLDTVSPDWVRNLLGDPRGIGLAIGVLCGGILQLLIQMKVVLGPIIKQMKLMKFDFEISSELKNVITLMIPASIAASSGPINVFVNTNFATSLGVGAVTWLNASFRLLQLPIGLFGVAVGMVVLPTLSRAVKNSKDKLDHKVAEPLQAGVELVSWLMILCFSFIFINHEKIISLIYQHGNFSFQDARATAQALFAYSFGILGYGLIKVVTSFYYAVERTKFAMKVALFSVIVNFCGNYILVDKFGYVGLALTSAMTLSVNATILMWGLKTHRLPFNYAKLIRSLALLSTAALASCLLMHFVNQFAFTFLSNLHHKASSAIVLAINGVFVFTVFSIFALIYLRKKPRAIIEQLGLFKAKP